MDKLSMEKAMIENMYDKTDKSIESWIIIVKGKNFSNYGEVVKYLKNERSLTHF